MDVVAFGAARFDIEPRRLHLRELLDGAGMLEYFDLFVFSDELGRSKPAPEVFGAVAEGFGVDVTGLVHIGDRPHNLLACLPARPRPSRLRKTGSCCRPICRSRRSRRSATNNRRRAFRPERERFQARTLA